MSKDHITKAQLTKALESFSDHLQARFWNMLRHQNQLILEYCNQCIESVTNLQNLENTMLGKIDDAVAQFGENVKQDLNSTLDPVPKLHALTNGSETLGDKPGPYSKER